MAYHGQSRKQKPADKNSALRNKKGTVFRHSRIFLIALIVVLVMVLAVLFILLASLRYGQVTQETLAASDGVTNIGSTGDAELQTEETFYSSEELKNMTPILFPYEVSDQQLTVNSFFGSNLDQNLPNPDAGGKTGNNLATCEIQNNSAWYLQSAEVYILLNDGTEHHFQIEDLPAGKTLLAFDTDNNVISEEAEVVSVICRSVQRQPDEENFQDSLEISVSGTEISVENVCDRNFENIEVVCHCDFGEQYFGGISYKYPVESLGAGESISVTADDCDILDAAVVSVRNQK